MRTRLTAEIDKLLTCYLRHHEKCLPSKEFPLTFMLLASIRDIEEDRDTTSPETGPRYCREGNPGAVISKMGGVNRVRVRVASWILGRRLWRLYRGWEGRQKG